MKLIPCKYIESGTGSCKFGDNCHYSHSVGSVNMTHSMGDLIPREDETGKGEYFFAPIIQTNGDPNDLYEEQQTTSQKKQRK